MEAKEVRVGNLFFDENDELKTLSCTNRVGDFVVEEETHWMGFIIIKNDLAKPIPLTEQWLERFGFKKEMYGAKSETNLELWIESWKIHYGTYRNGEKYFKLVADGGYDDSGELDLLPICKYVHQLQNLYFALTGKELTLK